MCSLVPDTRQRRGPEGSTSMLLESSRSTPTNGSRRIVVFDPDDLDAAFAELDARYLAGEAAAHAQTWSVDRGGLRRAQSATSCRLTTPDWVSIDHRRVAAFAPGELSGTSVPRHVGDQTPEALHRGGASAERPRSGRHLCGAWHLTRGLRRRVAGASTSLTIDGDMISRCELFDESDLDAALARFDELSRRRRGWKTRQAKRRALRGPLRGP